MKRILVAGIGNLFLGDDAFGVEVVRQLALHSLPDGITVIDFGIRGLDLAYALLDGYDLAILIDTTQRGGAPGTLYVLEPDTDHWRADQPAADAHGMVPEQAIRFARMLGDKLPPLRIIGCEPAAFDSGADGTFRLSEPVQAAVEPAIELVRSLIAEVLGTAEVETTGLSCMSWE
jgi:hydrogenase maturation protease